MKYDAIVVEESDGNYFPHIKTLDTNSLPAGELLVKVHYSSLNYKDALSVTGNKGVTKQYPHTPGIDAAGVVETSTSSDFSAGDKVIVTGYDLGMNTAGGFGQYIRVPAEWAVHLPENLSLKEAMIIGTAGFTAAISLSRLTELVKPQDGKIVVSGASGGVGSVALSLLTKLGYEVTAVSGKTAESEFLQTLGAKEVIARSEFEQDDKRPILSAQYAGAIDTVGGRILERILKTLKPLGAVTTCGSVSGTSLNMSVFPFILRGITLIGISAQNYPSELRLPLWTKLANEWKPQHLLNIYNEITLAEIPAAVNKILNGQLKGRTIVRMSGEV
ncbi:MAG: YhdH/YhfP family quinone oxidoreductase [Paludibacter sp.]|jgi:putative YhdH/YhfP family quinone oxidoreductase|nr:YhdH/YhfP family quinone oxidoreductase [Paludibacter sp.]